MSPLLPAVRARQVERHPALYVGIRHDPLYIDPSPGAGSTLPGFDSDWDEDYEQLEGLGPNTVLPQVAPVDTTDVPSSPSGIQGPPTITTAVQVSPVVVIPTISRGLSSFSLVPTPTLPAVISPSDTTSSSSSPPAATTSIFTPSTTTTQSSGPSFQGPRFGSVTIPAMVAATPSADSNPVLAGSTSGARKHTGLSGGAVAAIVIVMLLVTAALGFFLLRKRRIRRRTARRATWTPYAWRPPTANASLEKGVAEIDPISLPDIGAAAGAPSTRGSGSGAVQPRVPIIPRKSPPPYIPQTGEAPTTQPRSHGSPVYSSAPSPQPSAARTVAASESTQDAMGLVRVTFVPQLPDELAITPGETVYIRTEFDDGWALCANTRGEQGMVPLECLEGGGGHFAEFPPPSVDWHKRDSRRVSSLRSVA